MMASTVFQTWPCQTRPCQLPGANVVASPKIPSLPAHWYAATSVKPTAPSKTSAETTGRPSPVRRLCPKSVPTARAAQATTDEIIENTAPGFAALPTHALDRHQYFLAIRAHTDDDQQRDCGRLAVEPHVHHRAVENESHNRFGGQRASIPGVPIGLHLAPRRRRTAPSRRGAPGACWCRPSRCWQSTHRPPACGAGRPATSGCSTPWFCRLVRSAARVVLRSRCDRRCPSTTVSDGHAGDR